MTDLYRMQYPAHNMDGDFLECLEAANVKIVDRSDEPFNVVFEGTEKALRDLYQENWAGDDYPVADLYPRGALPCASIETVHKIRVDFEYGEVEDQEMIDNELFGLANRADAEETELFGGNAACAPYFTCEHKDLQAAHVLGRQLVDFLLKAGCKVTS